MHCVFMKLERTRASEVRPAMAMPQWSSTVKSFFWYDESSSALRWMIYVSQDSGLWQGAWVRGCGCAWTYLDCCKDDVGFAHDADDDGALLDGLTRILDLEDATLWGAVITQAVSLLDNRMCGGGSKCASLSFQEPI